MTAQPDSHPDNDPDDDPDGAPPPTEAGLGEATSSVWTRTDALACGLSADDVEGRLAAGVWQRLHRGVFCDAGVVASAVMRGWAAVLASGGEGRAWADGRTTLRLFALPLIDDDDPATGACDLRHEDVAVLSRARPRPHPDLHRRRRSRSFQAGTKDGCPSVSLEQALLTAAGVLGHEALVCALDAALHRGLLTGERLQQFLVDSERRRHLPALRQAVAAADGRAESPAETLCRLLLLPHLPGLVPQVRLRGRHGRIVARFDLADEQLRLAVEADGRRGHAGEQMAAKDRQRDAASSALGWTTERCTWFELRRRRPQLLAQVLAAAERQGRRGAA